MKRAGTDIKERNHIKATWLLREEEGGTLHQGEIIRKQQKDKNKQEEKHRTKAKAQQQVAKEDVAGYALVEM